MSSGQYMPSSCISVCAQRALDAVAAGYSAILSPFLTAVTPISVSMTTPDHSRPRIYGNFAPINRRVLSGITITSVKYSRKSFPQVLYHAGAISTSRAPRSVEESTPTISMLHLPLYTAVFIHTLPANPTIAPRAWQSILRLFLSAAGPQPPQNPLRVVGLRRQTAE